MAHESDQNSTEETQNDDVVGSAIRWSLGIIAALLSAGALLWALTRKPPEPVVVKAGPTTLPTERVAPALEIPEVRFTEITDTAGIDFVHTNGAEGEKLLPETMGGGGGFFDFDNDGDQDLLCVNGNVWPWAKVKPDKPPTSMLYANDGTGRFLNITAGSGLDIPLHGNGVAFGDFDNDGDVDVFISCLGANHLFRNDGGGKFAEVTAVAGVAGGENDWSTSCGWLDFDNDGDLDLFVCNYIQWNRELDQSMEFTLDGKLRAYGRPTDFTGAFPFLYRNEGNGTFVDVSDAAGVQIRDLNTNVPLSKSLGTTFCDVNADGLLDILVANDTVQNLLFLNQPGGTFIETAATAGIAFDNSGGARGAMGIDTACFRNSDAVGIAIGNFATEMTALYVCQTPGATIPIFRDEAVSNGIGPVTRTDLKFGVLFLDADLDGRLDLFENNGHLEEDIKVVQASQQYEQPPHLLWNCGTEFDNEFIMLPEAKTGADFQKRMVGRGASMADIDADGDLDLILFSSGGKPRLLRNDQKSGHHWLRLRLRGTKCNKDAIGTVVNVTLPNSTVLSRTVMPTRSYQSQTELPVTFGLGSAELVKEIAIRWPDGTSQKLSGISVDQQLEVIQEP
ncbi:MAG: CRTAC1 family protein [Planctomycetota bacterium]|nr:MAG: CRTAC1 family protein [Planctomycetota bacterium]